MRSVESAARCASARAVSDAATQRSASSVAGAGDARTRSSHSSSSPAARAARRSATASATPRSSSRVEHRVLGVGGVERVERRALRGALERLALEREQLLGVLALDAGLDERASASSMTSSASTRSRRRALGRGRRVVELVREPGRHRAERGEPLAAGSRALMPRITGPITLHHLAVHRAVRRARARRTARAGSSATPARGRRRRSSTPSRALGQRGDRADPGRRVLVADRLAAPVDHVHATRRALEQQQQAARRLALLDQHARPPRRRTTRRRAAHALELARRRARRRGRSRAAPSCDGHARRQVLVDQRDRHRALADRAGDALDRARAHVAGDEHARHARLQQVRVALERPAARPWRRAPARMKPRSSRATTPSSQSVRGAAPMKTKRRRPAPRARRRRRGSSARSRCPSPSAAIACAPVRTSTFGSAAICSIR